MSNILAENLLRFGAKGINEAMLKQYLAEQTQVPSAIYKKYVLTSTVAQLRNVINGYNPSTGAIKITDGNPWLATQRAQSLQQFLIKRFQGKFEIPFDTTKATISKTEVPGPGDNNQYMKATIKALLYKPPVKQDPYPYSILYNFYDIGGVPHIVVTKGGKGTPTKGAAQTTIDQMKSKMPADSILVRQNTGGSSETGPNPAESVTGIMIPIRGGFAAKSKGVLYFKDANQYTAMQKFISDYTDLADAQGKVKETGDLQKRTNLQTNFTSERGGGGNYIFGDLGTGRAAEVLAGDGAGSTITIKRMEPSKVGTLANQIVPGGAPVWANVDEILYRGLFPDNLITIRPDMYQKIFNDIQLSITELTSVGYQIKEMSADIQGFASTDNANNRCPQGFQPDHAWGGPITANLWITL
jgi:hypothetical protein